MDSSISRATAGRHPGAVSLERQVLKAAADFQGARDLGELGQAFVAATQRISPGDLIYIQHFHMRLGKVNALAPNIPWPFNADEQKACAQFFLRHPMAVAASFQPQLERVTLTEQVSHSQWRRYTLYNEVFRRNRFDFQQALNLFMDTESCAALVIMRSSLDYTDREKRSLEAINRVAVPALRRILRSERARFEHSLLAAGADEFGVAVIGLSPAGEIARLSAEASRLLEEHSGNTGPRLWREPLHRWLRKQSPEMQAPLPLLLQTESGHLRFRLVPGAAAGGGFVFVEEVQRHRPHPAYGLHGLSPRESEVLHAITEDLGDEMIAMRLGIGLRSVHEYVSRLFNKLGVSNRRAAAAWARSVRRTPFRSPASSSSIAAMGLPPLANDPLEASSASLAFARHAVRPGE